MDDVELGQDTAPDVGQPDAGCVADDQCGGKVTIGICRVARCESGQCVAANAPQDTPCDDGDACTSDDSCSDGVCIGTAVAACGGCGDGTCGGGETCESCESDCMPAVHRDERLRRRRRVHHGLLRG